MYSSYVLVVTDDVRGDHEVFVLAKPPLLHKPKRTTLLFINQIKNNAPGRAIVSTIKCDVQKSKHNLAVRVPFIVRTNHENYYYTNRANGAHRWTVPN
ncbi:hypothetical protein GWI33_007791 [Rhynchophorus ferrugineus]|uniref:Uncharacterized protein n=1 Tax=Rhynchophorus ferrugineus TaxID=354439 RepID=A0A834MEM8_RHYFE|nr:hypothetical protein GWI33_007791 [Rhynchophorus ferrugineus]